MWIIISVTAVLLININKLSDVPSMMRIFVGVFFLAFAIPKFMHLRGFAETFARYDVVARVFMPYAYVYPIIEFILGGAYLFNFKPLILNSITLFIMTLSSYSVFMAIYEGKKLRTAHMGGIFVIPLGVITLLENVVIAGIAMTLLWWL